MQKEEAYNPAVLAKLVEENVLGKVKTGRRKSNTLDIFEVFSA